MTYTLIISRAGQEEEGPHDPACWKNQSLAWLGVGGRLASCTCGADNEDLIFKHVLYFLAEPGRVKLLKKKWITIEDVTGLILHEEQYDGLHRD